MIGLILSLVACGGSKAQDTVPHLGFLSVSASPEFIESLRSGLNDLGYIEGQTVIIYSGLWRGSEIMLGLLESCS